MTIRYAFFPGIPLLPPSVLRGQKENAPRAQRHRGRVYPWYHLIFGPPSPGRPYRVFAKPLRCNGRARPALLSVQAAAPGGNSHTADCFFAPAKSSLEVRSCLVLRSLLCHFLLHYKRKGLRCQVSFFWIRCPPRCLHNIPSETRSLPAPVPFWTF